MTTAPNGYRESEGGGQKIIDFDCRGLEFIEFKPDVGAPLPTETINFRAFHARLPMRPSLVSVCVSTWGTCV